MTRFYFLYRFYPGCQFKNRAYNSCAKGSEYRATNKCYRRQKA